MPIKFACPSCQKSLSVKEEMAGKRAACPGCKKVLRIPAASTVPAAAPTGTTSELKHEDLEAIATSLLAEKKEEEAQVVGDIDLTCPYCDTAVKLPETLAGKQAPCPECRRIIKVPHLAPSKKKDWREKAPVGPSLAKRPEENLEGVWASEGATRVSTEALYEAGAVKEVRPPLTAMQWAKRIILLVMALTLVGGGYLIVSGWMRGSLEKEVQARLDEIIATVPTHSKHQFHRLRGEYYLELARRTPEKDKDIKDAHRQKAGEEFGQAIAALRAIGDDLERAAFCRDLLAGLTEPNAAGTVLLNLPRGPIRQGVLRELARSRLKSPEGLESAIGWLVSLVRADTNLDDMTAAYGVLGQELLPLNREKALEMANLAQAVAQGKFNYPLAVLLAALEQKAEAEPPTPDVRDMVNIEAAARTKRYAEAVKQLDEHKTLTDVERTQLLLVMADLPGNSKAEVEKLLTQAIKLDPKSAWDRERIVELTNDVGDSSQTESRAERLLGPSGKARVQVRSLLRKLKQEGSAADTAAVKAITAGPDRAIATYATARHFARQNAREAYAWAETCEVDFKPFGIAGVLHGMAETK